MYQRLTFTALALAGLVVGCLPVSMVETEVVDPSSGLKLDLGASGFALAVGEEVQIQGVPTMTDGAPVTGLYVMTWTSSAPAIVAVRDGRVRGMAPGEAEITATATLLSTGASASDAVLVTVTGDAAPPVDPEDDPPAVEQTFFAAGDSPASLVAQDDGTDGIVTGVLLEALSAGEVRGVRFLKGASDTGAHVGLLYRSSGELLAEVSFAGESATGWQEARFTSPVAIAAGERFVAAVFNDAGFYVSSTGFFTAPLTRGVLTAPADGAAGPNGRYLYSATPAFPNQGYQAANYWVDAIVATASSGGGGGEPPADPGAEPEPDVPPDVGPGGDPATGGAQCGDSRCEGLESCASCPADCGACDVDPSGQRALSFTAIPTSEPDLVAPGRGAENWHDQQTVAVPSEADPQQPLDVYQRSWFTWARLEPTQGAYDFSRLEVELQRAIDRGQKLSFGLMTIYPGDGTNPSPSAQGVGMSYPLYLHQLMQNAADPKNHGATDWNCPAAGWWLPNYNSEYYLDRFDALNRAINQWLHSTRYNGVLYATAIGYVDIRGFGSWGEWHHYPFIDNAPAPDGSPGSWPVGMRPTLATLKRIVDSHVRGYPDFQLLALMSIFDAEWFYNTWNPPEIAQYVLDVRNNVGPVGIRRDQWGSGDQYIHDYLENNNRSVPGGVPLRIPIMERWKLAPVGGEPGCYGGDQGGLLEEVELYHAAMIGNGNFCRGGDVALSTNYRAAMKRSGYRLVLTGGAAPQAISAGSGFVVALRWQNLGVAPTYETWDAVLELRDAGQRTVWSGISAFRPRGFVPQASATEAQDFFTLPATVAPGTYQLVLVVRDPSGYREPLPLAIRGRAVDGSYALGAVTVQ